LTKNKKILFLGKRLDAIQVAVESGYDVYVMNYQRGHKKIKPTKSKKYFEVIYNGNFDSLKHIDFDVVIPMTEKAVELAYAFYKTRKLTRPDLEKYHLCHNKLAMKEHAKKMDIPVTEFQAVETPEHLINCLQTWGSPIVVKEIESSGGRGQRIIESADDIPEKLETKMIAEKWIKGKEFSVESFVYQGQVIFNNITEYHTHYHCNILPSYYSTEQKSQIVNFNQKVIQKFNIQNGIAHAEFFQTPTGLVLGEVAVRPPGGYLMKLIEMAYGFSPWRALIDIESGIKPFVYDTPKTNAAVWIIHPGEMTVEKEPDFISVLNHPAIVDLKCGLKKGMKIPLREGSGQDFGRILMKSQDYQELISLIDKIKNIA